jgi:hypothetical protein
MGLGNAEGIAHSVDCIVAAGVTKGAPQKTFLVAFLAG